MATGSYTTDPFEVFCFASAYLSGAIAISKVEFSDGPKPLGEHVMSEALQIPGVILQILCLEVYLKCLILVRGNAPPNTHDTKVLFNALSADDQKAIRDEYQRSPPRNLLGGAVIEFDSVLDRTENTFKTVRYGYERPSPREPADGVTRGNLGFKEAIRAVQSVILVQHPDWFKRYQTYTRLL